MEKIFNKLVRDNIPNIIESNNEIAVTKILDEDAYQYELYKKLKEECDEVLNSKNNLETLEELADVLEIIKSIAELKNKNLDDVIEIAKEKRLKRGGFKQRIFLEKTIDR